MAETRMRFTGGPMYGSSGLMLDDGEDAPKRLMVEVTTLTEAGERDGSPYTATYTLRDLVRGERDDVAFYLWDEEPEDE